MAVVPVAVRMSKTEVIRRYRQLLRIAEAWPVESERPGRNLRDAIRNKVRSDFRSRAAARPEDVGTHLQESTRELNALEYLLGNYSSLKVGVLFKRRAIKYQDFSKDRF